MLDNLELVARPEGVHNPCMSSEIVCLTSEMPTDRGGETGDLMANHDEPDRAEDGRLMFYENQLQERPRHSSRLGHIPVEEARVLLQELLRRFDISPLPPAGLPGHLHSKYNSSDREAELLGLGFRYVSAVVFNQRRSMHNVWADARDLLNGIHWAERKAIFEEIGQREREAAERRAKVDQAEAERRAATSIYFIGAASGPIKIGIAIDPIKRLKSLQTSHHEKLEILATVAGEQADETAYHKRFAAHRLKGEWFERVPEILEEIERLSK